MRELSVCVGGGWGAAYGDGDSGQGVGGVCRSEEKMDEEEQQHGVQQQQTVPPPPPR